MESGEISRVRAINFGIRGHPRIWQQLQITLLFVNVLSSIIFSEPISQSLQHTEEFYTDLKHICVRNCILGDTRVCYYKFKAEWYSTMSKACHDCPFNLTECARPHCIIADGIKRPLMTINRRVPGPTIDVCRGDEIIVDVENHLHSDTTTIHWHGLHMLGTPYMDGVPFLTQCPIHPMTSFRYHFMADTPGTHYWHSHSGFQRTDGVFGAIIVRQANREEPLRQLYDEDDPRHVLIVTDWLDRLGIDKFVSHHHTEHDNKPYEMLVNGRGKNVPLTRNSTEVFTPIYELDVEKGLRYRFRTISNSIQNCPIVISIDNHTMLIIASDGQPMQPFRVESLVIYGGERWDFVVDTSSAVGNYWIKFQGLLDCDDRFRSAHQVAVMRYAGAVGFPEPISKINYNSTKRAGMQLNSLNAAPGNDSFRTVAEIRSIRRDRRIERKPDLKFWLDFDFYGKDNDMFHHPIHYPFFGVDMAHRLFMPQINNITLMMPNVPPISQPEEVDENSFCNSTSHSNCQDKFCHCPHVLNVAKGSLVELILIDTGVIYWANHPFHLHGYSFWVLAMERLGENTTVEKVKDLDAKGLIRRNLDHPPLKDTVTVPDGGYTVIRFYADNPGYWLFHCHISFHSETGMGLIFRVGNRTDLPAAPSNFPRCSSYTPAYNTSYREEISAWVEKQSFPKIEIDLRLLKEMKNINDSNYATHSPVSKGNMSSGSSASGQHASGKTSASCKETINSLMLIISFICMWHN